MTPSPPIEDTLAGQSGQLWAIAVDVWNTSFLGVGVGQGLLALLLVLIGFAARGLISRWLIDVLNLLTGNLDEPAGAMFPAPAADLAQLASLRDSNGTFDEWTTRVRGAPTFNGESPTAVLAEEIETPGANQIKALVVVGGNPRRRRPTAFNRTSRARSPATIAKGGASSESLDPPAAITDSPTRACWWSPVYAPSTAKSSTRAWPARPQKLAMNVWFPIWQS